MQKILPTRRFFFSKRATKPNPVLCLDRNRANRPTNTPLHISLSHVSFVVQRLGVDVENNNNNKRSPTCLYVWEISESYFIVISLSVHSALAGEKMKKTETIHAVITGFWKIDLRAGQSVVFRPHCRNSVCYSPPERVVRAIKCVNTINGQSVGNRSCSLTSVAARRYA